jgi:hypothetical protein
MQHSRTPPDDRRPALQPPQFGLLGIFVALTVIAVLFAVTHYFGSYGAAIVALFVLCVVAHVVGNALGTRLRDFGDQPVRADGSPAPRSRQFQKPSANQFAPHTRLRDRSSLGKRILFVTVFGAGLGAFLGFVGVQWVADDRTTWPVFLLGTGACAVLGAIWTFATASFLQVTVGEFLHARRNSG